MTYPAFEDESLLEDPCHTLRCLVPDSFRNLALPQVLEHLANDHHELVC